MKKLCFGVFLSAILAGIMIGIGGSVYLSLATAGNKLAGALFFAVGLFTIIIFKLHLFTGKVGYLVLPGDSPAVKAVSIIMTVLGNFVGTFLIGTAFAQQYITQTNVMDIVAAKLNLTYLDAFLLAIPCGILMFVAVEGYKRATSDAVKCIIVLFSVAVFILSGFEHSIADMFYVAAAEMLSLQSVLFIVVVILGNAVGGAGFAALSHYSKKLL